MSWFNFVTENIFPSGDQKKVTFAATLSLGTFGAIIYLLRERRKRYKSPLTSRDKFFRRRSLSVLQNLNNYVATKRRSDSIGNSVDSKPEEIQSSYRGDSSWISSEQRRVSHHILDGMHNGLRNKKLCVCMVGLPGAGKTNIAMKIARYLRWLRFRCRVFSLAKYRLDKVGNKCADFFDSKNEKAYQQRLDIMKAAVTDAKSYLTQGGDVVIIDGANTTRERRQVLRDHVGSDKDIEILWIESKHIEFQDQGGRRRADSCAPVLHSDFLENSPDYLDAEDYAQRIKYYVETYESLSDYEESSITVTGADHTQRKLELRRIHGFIPTKIVSFMMNLHTQPRIVYLCRHGESEFNVRGLIGGDAGVSPKGIEFAHALGDFFESTHPDGNYMVWSSTMRRARETANELRPNVPVVEWRSLRDLDAGICDGLSYKQIQIMFPDEHRQREKDKLRYRYPRGESYLDVINRLESVIFELERRHRPVVIVGHQAVLRCLYSYFLDIPEANIPHLALPLHTVIKLEPNSFGCKERRFKFFFDGEGEIEETYSDITP